jgi:hypothetical protein
MSFVHGAGPRQHSLSTVRVPWDSRPYFTVSDSLHCRIHKSQSHIATDGQSVSQSVSLGVESPSGAHDQIFIDV